LCKLFVGISVVYQATANTKRTPDTHIYQLWLTNLH